MLTTRIPSSLWQLIQRQAEMIFGNSSFQSGKLIFIVTNTFVPFVCFPPMKPTFVGIDYICIGLRSWSSYIFHCVIEDISPCFLLF